MSVSNIQTNSSILDESSITSVLYLRAKAVYKMRRIFNQLRLQRVFDALLIKVFRNDDHEVLVNERAMRLVKLKTVVSRQLYKA